MQDDLYVYVRVCSVRVCVRRGTYLGELMVFCFSSCRNLANGETGLGAARVMLSITAHGTFQRLECGLYCFTVVYDASWSECGKTFGIFDGGAGAGANGLLCGVPPYAGCHRRYLLLLCKQFTIDHHISFLSLNRMHKQEKKPM